MNPMPLRTIVSTLIAAFAASAAPLSAQAAVDCSAPRGLEQQRACKAAAEGVQSLRRFSERTRTIYAVYMPDYAKAIPRTAATPVAGRQTLAERR